MEPTLAQLREMALAEAPTEAIKPPVEAPAEQPRDPATGRFQTQRDHFDNADEVAEVEAQPLARYEKIITNDDGSRDVYRANDLQSLVDQISEGKKAAVRQMKLVQAEKRALEQQLGQVDEDSRFILEQKLKSDPKSAIKSVVEETIQERDSRARAEDARIQASADAQRLWVASRPEYVATKTNADRILSEIQRQGGTEISVATLESAFQVLAAQGKLELKQPEPPAPVSTGRRGSTISHRHSGASFGRPSTAFNEQEAYSISMDELKRRANAELKGNE
jgi:hypothetical protein